MSIKHNIVSWDETRKRFISIFYFLFLFCISLLLLTTRLRIPLGIYDESIPLLNASNILKGAIPYKDFWTLYSPGYYFVIAFVFSLFGTNVQTARLFDLFLQLIFIFELILLARIILNRVISIFYFMGLLFWLYYFNLSLSNNIPALCFVFGSILCFYHYLEKERDSWIIYAGILLGISGIIRIDFWVYGFVSISLGFFLRYYLQSNHPKILFKKYFLSITKLIISTFTIIITFYSFIGILSGFQLMIEDMIIFPFINNRVLRDLPKPSLLPIPHDLGQLISWGIYYSAIFILLISFLFSIKDFINQYKNRTYSSPLFVIFKLVITLFGSLMVIYASSRFDYYHIFPVSIISLIIFLKMVQNLLENWRTDFLQKKILNYISLVSCLILLLPQILLFILCVYSTSIYPISGCYSKISRAGCVFLHDGQEEVVKYVQTYTEVDEPIFVGNSAHDRIFINDVSLYFLSGRPGANKYYELYPGVATTERIQKIIVSSLIDKKVKLVILADIDNPGEPNGSSINSGVTILDDYIQSNYSYSFTSGIFHVYIKNQ